MNHRFWLWRSTRRYKQSLRSLNNNEIRDTGEQAEQMSAKGVVLLEPACVARGNSR